MASILKNAESSLGFAVATGALTYGLYSFNVPSVSVVHATAPNDVNVEAGRKKAAITAGIAVVGISVLTRDVNVFIVGGVILILLDFSIRHANSTHPVTGELVSPAASGNAALSATGASLSAQAVA